MCGFITGRKERNLDQRIGTDLKEVDQDIVSMEAEVPEALFHSMRGFIKANPSWDQYQLVSSALATFLFQNGSSDKTVATHYLNSLFNRSEA